MMERTPIVTPNLPSGKSRLAQLIQKAAAVAVAQEDVWAKHDIPSIPAERVIRHLYHPETQSWTQEDTIVKMEKHAFAHGAMRHCFRMKKMATPPQSSSNHRFHSYGWSRASNYVAKAYMTSDGQVDCSPEAKAAVKNDILLQYEANHWAMQFNDLNPPKTICFIRAYAVEFPHRPGSPWFAVERYIAGKDSYGVSFVKHNTNSGFVDTELRRTTPQVFSAFSFYASQGNRLVADIQGVGDLFTDPQVLSADYRFGDGDLGPRGMALFFHSFRHCSLSDKLGIPIFPLSKNELKHQAKYHEDDDTVSSDEEENGEYTGGSNRFLLLDLNRVKRQSMLKLPTDLDQPEDARKTMMRSNLTHPDAIRNSIRLAKQSFTTSMKHPPLSRSRSDVDDVGHSIEMATTDAVFDHRAFHRKASGELRKRSSENHRRTLYRNDIEPASPIMPTIETKANLGRVHYQLACLHGLGRFPEQFVNEEPDVTSIVFHLSKACSLRNVSACLALGRVRAGLGSVASDLLQATVPVDFGAARELFQRAMEASPLYAPAQARAAAGCLLLQLLREEEDTTDATLIGVLAETIQYLKDAQREERELEAHNQRVHRGGTIQIGDRVEANYCMEGTFYPGTVITMNEDSITVQYDDDNSSEALSKDEVRPLIPLTASQSDFGSSLTEGEALGAFNDDEQCIFEIYALQAELAELKAIAGNVKDAAVLFEEASDGAINAGKMKTATEYSMRAAELAAE
jgi:elongation factor 2 kinase